MREMMMMMRRTMRTMRIIEQGDRHHQADFVSFQLQLVIPLSCVGSGIY